MCMLTTGILASFSAAGRAGPRLALPLLLLLSTLTHAQAEAPTFDEIVRQADAARQTNQFSLATDLYTQALGMHPDWSDGWWSLAMLQYKTGAYAQSRDALTHFLALQPQAGPGFAFRGMCEFETGEYKQSLDDLRQGLALQATTDPQNQGVLRFHVALLLALRGDFEAALTEYLPFARDGVKDQDVLIGIGLAGLRIAVLPKDLKADLRELALDAGSATAHAMAGNEDDAEREFNALFGRYPKAQNLHYLRGYLLFKNDPGRATEEFKRELDVTPANPSAEMMLAWCLLMQSDPTGALPYAQKAASAEPEAPAAQLVLGRSLLETNAVQAGLEHLQTAVKLDPDNLEIHLALVKAYSLLGNKSDAQQERTRCLALTRNEAPIGRP